MNPLVEKLSRSMIAYDTDYNRKKWAKYIISEKVPLNDLLVLLEYDRKIATRFIWLVGDLCEKDPEIVFPNITYFFSFRRRSEITNYNRSLAKMFRLCGIPKEIEGEVTSEMFKWVQDPNVIVSTKNYSLLALCNLALKYDDLKNELRLVIDDQYDKNSIAFKKCATNVLKKING